MKFPSMPMKGKPVDQTVIEIINYLRSVRVTSMVGGTVKNTPNGTTLAVMRDRQTFEPSSHPWKVSGGADGIASVNDGLIYGFILGATGETTWVGVYAEWAKADVTVTAAGYIYAAATYGPAGVGTIECYFSTDDPVDNDPDDGKFHIPIAQVELVDGSASVIEQLLTHNPIIQVQGQTHPFKVTPNGDATVAVAPGEFLGWLASDVPTATYVSTYSTYAGGNVTVTAAGYIYAAATYNQTDGVGTITMTFSEDDPADYLPDDGKFHIPIAQVALVGGDAVVDNQFLTSNPLIQLAEPRHPWQVTANGDDTVAVAAGRMITHRTNGTGDLGDPASLVGYFLDFGGDASVTVTANGYIYALCDIDVIVTGDDTLSGGSGARFYSERQVFAGTPEVVFSTVAPATFDPYADHGRNFSILLANVTYAASVATVVNQYVKTDIPPVGGSYTYEATP